MRSLKVLAGFRPLLSQVNLTKTVCFNVRDLAFFLIKHHSS